MSPKKVPNTLKIHLLLIASLTLWSCGGGGGSSPAPTTPPTGEHPENQTPPSQPPASEPPVVIHNSYKIKSKSDAALFLNRTTYGPTLEDINALFAVNNYETWLDEQFAMPATFHLPDTKALGKKMCSYTDPTTGTSRIDSWEFTFARHQIWWEAAMHAPDQLRQRVALALSEILVISDTDGFGLDEFGLGVTGYYDLMVKHAFGNYRELLEEVTLNPAMGDFLSMTRNQKAIPAEGIRPDENYAREVLQLFSIGVHQLKLDASVKKDSNGNAIPTYKQKTIEEFAKVFTGWNYANIGWDDYYDEGDHTIPLTPIESYHDNTRKTLLNGEASLAGQSAQADLDFALDNIFKHPNVAPFVSKRLIQRLVTSNPSPSYIARVATVFNDNGQGVKGDLKAVVKAILLDGDALSQSKPDHFGKLREPMLRLSHVWRVFKMQPALKIGHYWESFKTCGEGNYPYFNLWASLDAFKNLNGQGALQAKSVFNFFSPSFSPNGVLNDQGLVAPEFQILNANTLSESNNLIHGLISETSDSKPTAPVLDGFSKLDLSRETALAANTDELLDYLNLVLFSNKMTSELRAILKTHLNTPDIFVAGEQGRLDKAREAIILSISSPEYLIQR